MDDQKTELVFQLWSDDTGVFFTKEDHRRLKTIEAALEQAKTWRDFERLCPEGEFAGLSSWWCNDGEYIYEIDGEYRLINPGELDEFWRACGRDFVIEADDSFDQTKIPGRGDGDYPPWTLMTADEVLPREFFQNFGTRVGSPAAGVWNEYPFSELNTMQKWLEERGFSVTTCLSYD